MRGGDVNVAALFLPALRIIPYVLKYSSRRLRAICGFLFVCDKDLFGNDGAEYGSLTNHPVLTCQVAVERDVDCLSSAISKSVNILSFF